jgi:hypothetical protein
MVLSDCVEFWILSIPEKRASLMAGAARELIGLIRLRHKRVAIARES